MAYGARRRPKNGIHKVAAGETVSSIAASYGFTDWEAKVWNAAENAQLKEKRINPNTLLPGDEVFIPELEQKQEGRPVDAWHQFHVKRNKRFLRVKLQNADDTAIANRPYTIEPEPTFRGVFVQKNQTTSAEGMVEEEIPHTLTKATLVLPEDNLRVKLQVGFLQPLPASEPVEGPSLDVGGALSGAADALRGGLGSLGDIASGAGGDLMGAAKGAAGAAGSLGGGFSAGGNGGGLSMSGGGGMDGAAGAAAGLGGEASGIAKAAAKKSLGSASAMVGAAAGAISDALGLDALGGDEKDPNIYPSAQRLHSMGFKPGEPKDNKRTAQFSAAVMEFQTWCKKQGNLASGAGGPLGSLTSPGGMLGGGGGPLGEIAGAVAGPMLAAVGLTGQLDKETIEALKKVHGC